MALTITAFETTNWTTTTTPLTISVTGALTGDQIVVIYGGDNGTGSGAVTAATVSTTGGTTGAWTEPEEGLAAANQAWISSSTATVTADGTVTVSMARTQSTGLLWGGMALLVRGHGGIGNHTRVAPSATETASLTVSQGSAVAMLAIDWDALAVVAFSPSGSTEVQRAQAGAGPDLTDYAAYWLNQAAGTRGYGIGTSSTTNLHIIAIEILDGTPATEQNQANRFAFWRRWNRERGMFKSTYDLFVDQAPAVAAVPADTPILPIIVRALEAPAALPYLSVSHTQVAADLPARPVVVPASQPTQPAPFVAVSAVRTDPIAVAPDVVPRPMVVAAPQPLVQPFVTVSRTTIGDTFPARAAVTAAGLIPQALPFTFVGEVRTEPPAAAPSDTPARAVVARAVELPPATGTVFVDQTRADPPAAAPSVPVHPTIVAVQPPPQAVPTPTVNRTPAPPVVVVDHPTVPLVAAGATLPPPAGWSLVNRTPVAPAVVSGQPPRPTVVTITSVPAPGFVAVSRPVATDQPSATRPVVVTSATVKPVEIAAVITPRTWGPPPPILRRPATPIVVDLSPPPQYGQARISHGFAEGIVGTAPLITNPVLRITPNRAGLTITRNLADLEITGNDTALTVTPNRAGLTISANLATLG